MSFSQHARTNTDDNRRAMPRVSATSERSPLPRALTIAGSDSGGGAGIQADLKTFTVLGTYGMSVITAVTAQNTLGVTHAFPMTTEQIVAQLDAVLADIGVDAVKTGMLVNAEIVKAVAERLKSHVAGDAGDLRRNAANELRLVVDPVMVAKSGDVLLERASVTALRKQLLPLALLVTPNIPEAEVLAGMKIGGPRDMAEAGRRLLDFGVQAVLVTGGHLPGNRADDVLVTADGEVWLPGDKIDTRHTHGTGCTLSAALTAALARGLALPKAVAEAKRFITDAIREAPGLGGGHGPTNHLAWLESAPSRSAIPGKE